MDVIDTQFIRQKALGIGFDLVGFARAEKLIPEGTLFEEWIERGFHGEMKWLENNREKRVDPRLLFENAKTVVSLAVNYYDPTEHSESDLTGKISRYAWGDDYHDVIRSMLNELIDLVNQRWPEVRAKGCVDTAPIMDKSWAARAGLGWIGKHTNLITRELGSWVFLAEIIIDHEVDCFDEPIEDHCGNCTACLDACPTNAIVEPYLVDSNRCISYATIELRSEELPSLIAENLNGWLYGCDICQDVCPWNRFQKDSLNPSFVPRPHNISPVLSDIDSMVHENYIELFRKSAIKRTKLQGLKRNASALLEIQNRYENKTEID